MLKEGESLGFGIIEYAEAEEATTAFQAFVNHKINDVAINISYCIPGLSAVHMFNRVMFKYVSIGQYMCVDLLFLLCIKRSM